MKSVQIGKLSNGQPLKLDVERLVKSRLALLASSGGGKTWAAFKLLEATRGMLPQIIIDPEGEFSVLRRRHDYVLAAPKGGDVLAHPSLAEALAKRCMEKNFSLIIDLFEMEERDQHRYVRIFLETIFAMPKSMWRPRLLLVDEGHEFAPEAAAGNSEALPIMKRVSKKGRKRGIGFIVATQRPAEISKAVTSQCGNKLVGVAYQDVDRKRAASELEFTTKEEVASLRRLEPGTFYAYGPALGFDIKLATIDIPKDRPEEGGHRSARPPAPSANLKGILSTLTELPKEAKEEARTIEELKAKVKELEKQVLNASKTTHAMGAVVSNVADGELKKLKEQAMKRLEIINQTMDRRRIESIQKAFRDMKADLNKAMDESFAKQKGVKLEPARIEIHDVKERAKLFDKQLQALAFRNPSLDVRVASFQADQAREMKFGACERAIVGFLAFKPERTWTKIQVAVGTGYSVNSGGFNNAMGKLRSAGAIKGGSDALQLADDSVCPGTQPEENPLEAWKKHLGQCERKIWNLLMEFPSQVFTKEEVGEKTGYSANSGGFNNSLGRLNSLALIKRVSGGIRLNPEIEF